MNRATVIGGGIVGCHIALEFAGHGWDVFLLEKNPGLGQETSSRNSGVLHAGIYYPPDSLKARLCVEGNRLSREFFEKYGVRYSGTGKFIISRNALEENELEVLYDTARQNGAPAAMVPGKAVSDTVPSIRCIRAIHSPSTAIIDTGDYLGVLKTLLYQPMR